MTTNTTPTALDLSRLAQWAASLGAPPAEWADVAQIDDITLVQRYVDLRFLALPSYAPGAGASGPHAWTLRRLAAEWVAEHVVGTFLYADDQAVLRAVLTHLRAGLDFDAALDAAGAACQTGPTDGVQRVGEQVRAAFGAAPPLAIWEGVINAINW